MKTYNKELQNISLKKVALISLFVHFHFFFFVVVVVEMLDRCYRVSNNNLTEQFIRQISQASFSKENLREHFSFHVK